MNSLARATPIAAFVPFAETLFDAKPATLLRWSVVILLAGGAPAAYGQSALDGFNPNANGAVRAVVVQPDGKILIGGDFTTLSPNGGAAVTRNRIARLNPDGTLDPMFDPNANGIVYAIAVQADGRVLVGGEFLGLNSIGGQPRNFFARLDATTGLADSFDPDADNIVRSIVVQSDGKILVGGLFAGANSMGGERRNHIARLDPTTGMADSFDPDANGNVFSIAVQADGKIVAAGQFSNVGGQPRNCIARLDPTSGAADSFNPNANSTVNSVAVQADGLVLAGGAFFGANSIGGATRNRIARLDATTGLADSFNPNANGIVRSIIVQPDGGILVGGDFFGPNSIGGQTRNRMARLNAVTGIADSFDPNMSGSVTSIAVQADGKILAGGLFNGASSVGGQTRNRIARLGTDGRLDRTVDLSIVGGLGVLAIAVQPDGKILIGGDFSSVLGVSRNNIARLNSDGTLDNDFNPNANDQLRTIAVQADGKILAGGFFTSIGGQPRNNIARLDAATGLADEFDPNANDHVYSISVEADGKILAGGVFTSIGGQLRNRIVRLDPTGGSADLFDPNANGNVFAIAVQADGKILVGGEFTSVGGEARNRIARLDAISGSADGFNPNANSAGFGVGVCVIALQADGRILAGGDFTVIGGEARNRIARLDATTGLADSFNPDANHEVRAIAVQADGKILAGGFFTSIGGQAQNRIARLDPTSGLADSFNQGASDTVWSIAIQADGKILVGGEFGTIGGQTRSRFARLSNDTAALQNLGVTQSSISWTRGGSSPQLSRVSFEYSTDNVNYTPLGNGTSAGSDWILTGLNLSTGQNNYIRARGYYRSGYVDGSESITESVRNAFLFGPPTLSISDVTNLEGNSGTTAYVFTVTKTGTTASNTMVDYETVDGTATIADSDYQSKTGTLMFAPFETTRLITVLVNRDTTVEADEMFSVHLSDATNATIGDADGTGTIENDDCDVCTALDQCHLVGTCDPETGQCTDPIAPDGTGCDDLNACTTTDVCTGGLCAGELRESSGTVPSLLFMTLTPERNLALSWLPSCDACDDDYEIYAGTFPAPGTPFVYNHVPVFCTTAGARSIVITLEPGEGFKYYLVVPRNALREGSYGQDNNSAQRPQGLTTCRAQVIGCP